MTDRHAGFIVTLDGDYRSDDAEHIAHALRMVKGVIDVSPIVSDVELHLAEKRRDHQWSEGLMHLLREGPDA